MTNPASPHKQKLYCFVDESGQDTEGEIFLVSVVVTGEERDRLLNEAERIERDTGKGLTKWQKAPFDRRLSYITRILALPELHGKLFFSHTTQSKSYVALTVATTAKAITARATGEYKATIIVDGLSGREIIRFTRDLRRFHIAVRKVRGARDESSALIRLADALAGFLRDALEGQEYARKLYEEAVRKGVVRRV